MNENWKQWEGQTVDGKFVLRQFRASTDHSGVFLTQLAAPSFANAILKFISGNGSAAEARLAAWKRAAQLSHKNLLAIHDCGRCALSGQSLLYVVMEYAEENLAEILPQRALSPEEARDVLDPALDLLVYLHAKGLAHGHLKPSNFLATQDCLKLSSDSLATIGSINELSRTRDVYDAPEIPSATLTPKADVWSLGVTLFEALTQRTPEPPQDRLADLAIPGGLPELFRDIVSHSLRRQPEHRWSVAEIAARVNPAPLAAAAAASASPSPTLTPPLSPLNVPLASEPAVPLAKLHSTPANPFRPNLPAAKRRTSSPSDYLIPVLLGAAVFFGLIFAVPKLINFRSQPASPQASVNSAPSTPSKPAAVPHPQEDTPPAEKISVMNSPNAASTKSVEQPAAISPPPPAKLPAESPAVSPVKSSETNDAHGEILDQVLPHPSSKALAGIQGTIRVVVNVEVDSSGKVSNAELTTPGPSQYFANLAEKAARQWKFAGAEADGHGVPSQWQIRFEFVPSGVHAFPKQLTP